MTLEQTLTLINAGYTKADIEKMVAAAPEEKKPEEEVQKPEEKKSEENKPEIKPATNSDPIISEMSKMISELTNTVKAIQTAAAQGAQQPEQIKTTDNIIKSFIETL